MVLSFFFFFLCIVFFLFAHAFCTVQLHNTSIVHYFTTITLHPMWIEQLTILCETEKWILLKIHLIIYSWNPQLLITSTLENLITGTFQFHNNRILCANEKLMEIIMNAWPWMKLWQADNCIWEIYKNTNCRNILTFLLLIGIWKMMQIFQYFHLCYLVN